MLAPALRVTVKFSGLYQYTEYASQSIFENACWECIIIERIPGHFHCYSVTHVIRLFLFQSVENSSSIFLRRCALDVLTLSKSVLRSHYLKTLSTSRVANCLHAFMRSWKCE